MIRSSGRSMLTTLGGLAEFERELIAEGCQPFKSGIGLPKLDAELIAVRLRRARELDAED